jgi:hypothetical protein
MLLAFTNQLADFFITLVNICLYARACNILPVHIPVSCFFPLTN